MKKRIDYLDKAKGIAIILVIFLHIPSTVDFIGYELWGGWIRTFYMPFFFLCSGLFFRPINLCKKIWRLVVPLLFFNALSLLYNIRSVIKGEQIDIIQQLLSYLGLTGCFPNPPMWFLLSLIEIFVISYFGIKYLKPIICFSISVLLGFMANELVSHKIVLLFYWEPTMLCCSCFLVGYYGNSLILSLKKWQMFLALLMSVLFFMIRPEISTISDVYIPQGFILFFLSAVLGSIGVFGICQILRGYVGGILDFYGKNSLILLGTHWILLTIPNHLLKFVSNIYLCDTIGLIIILLIEIPIIFFINHKAPWIVGKFQNK